MAGKISWLESGLVILGASGPTALTIDRLVAETGVSTGSFYHHFRGMQGYKAALLEHFESVHTTHYIQEVEATAGLDARGRLELLVDLVLDSDEPANIELAISAWALSEPLAAAAKQRVDKTRVDFLHGLLLQGGCTEDDARATAGILYLMVLGAASMRPAMPPEELRALCERVLP
ncbi:AcrR family transcriptional regulator [Nocardia transvalensis]|uniref:AcrR family transcriptional regulator n=1 Tax=Nocardia transvalensis TaxID=37333 RepID=A0A7W9UJP2_9NOCA|nr:TetR/AcrR family transcriptional regulator [Nocardia transvalensis]MBB5914880.1 AcrR family transcriptional regulator [Nocardia transvalensis]